ncbi:unnamed protein product [Durusdinium trenchii]|uniref:Uncharacterized protein n=1 Tax=Durusdinium trenchii TaxID=1381693 RepID=A0ABP0I2Y8_9DINO
MEVLSTPLLTYAAQRGVQSRLLLVPRCGHGSFLKLIRSEPSSFIGFLRETLRVIEEVEGHENYNLRITAGSLPLRGLEPPAELVEDLARAGFSVSIFADAARKREPADADTLLDLDAAIDYQDASGRHVRLPITSGDITLKRGEHTRCALDAQGRPVLVVVLERFVRFQRDCSDAELLELWTLALNVIEESSGPQEGDPFVDMRLNAGTFQNIRHLHLKVWLNRKLFESTWAAHPAYKVLAQHRDERRARRAARPRDEADVQTGEERVKMRAAKSTRQYLPRNDSYSQ